MKILCTSYDFENSKTVIPDFASTSNSDAIQFLFVTECWTEFPAIQHISHQHGIGSMLVDDVSSNLVAFMQLMFLGKVYLFSVQRSAI